MRTLAKLQYDYDTLVTQDWNSFIKFTEYYYNGLVVENIGTSWFSYEQGQYLCLIKGDYSL